MSNGPGRTAARKIQASGGGSYPTKTVVQAAGESGSVGSGVASNLFTANVTAGNGVLLGVIVNNTGTGVVTAVSGLGITNWTNIAAYRVGANYGAELWYGTGSAGASKAVTITDSTGSATQSAGYEIHGMSNVLSQVYSFTSASPLQDSWSVPANSMAVVVAQATGAFSSTSAGWSSLQSGVWIEADGNDLSYLISASAGNVTYSVNGTGTLYAIGATIV